MKILMNAVLVFLSFFIVTSYAVQAEEPTNHPNGDYVLAISFTDTNPDIKRFKFRESIVRLDIESLYNKLERLKGVNMVSLYKDGVAVTREPDALWEELEKNVMLVLKDQFQVTGYVLLDSRQLTVEQIENYLQQTVMYHPSH